MFETTTRDGEATQVRLSFWQCVKAGIAFGIGYTIVSVFTNAFTAFTVFTSIAGFLRALSGR